MDPNLYSMIPGFTNNKPKLMLPGKRFPIYERSNYINIKN